MPRAAQRCPAGAVGGMESLSPLSPPARAGGAPPRTPQTHRDVGTAPPLPAQPGPGTRGCSCPSLGCQGTWHQGAGKCRGLQAQEFLGVLRAMLGLPHGFQACFGGTLRFGGAELGTSSLSSGLTHPQLPPAAPPLLQHKFRVPPKKHHLQELGVQGPAQSPPLPLCQAQVHPGADPTFPGAGARPGTAVQSHGWRMCPSMGASS